MKKTIVAIAAAFGLVACTSVETATVSGSEIAANGEAVAVVQANALGLTAIFHMIDLVQSDLDTVVNKLLVAEAKAMGALGVLEEAVKLGRRHRIPVSGDDRPSKLDILTVRERADLPSEPAGRPFELARPVPAPPVPAPPVPAPPRWPLSTYPCTPWSASGLVKAWALTVRLGSESAPIVSSTPPV